MTSSARSTEAPFAAEGGLGGPTATALVAKDPFRALDDLMALVEALCPIWPERGIFVSGGKMRL